MATQDPDDLSDLGALPSGDDDLSDLGALPDRPAPSGVFAPGVPPEIAEVAQKEREAEYARAKANTEKEFGHGDLPMGLAAVANWGKTAPINTNRIGYGLREVMPLAVPGRATSISEIADAWKRGTQLGDDVSTVGTRENPIESVAGAAGPMLAGGVGMRVAGGAKNLAPWLVRGAIGAAPGISEGDPRQALKGAAMNAVGGSGMQGAVAAGLYGAGEAMQSIADPNVEDADKAIAFLGMGQQALGATSARSPVQRYLANKLAKPRPRPDGGTPKSIMQQANEQSEAAVQERAKDFTAQRQAAEAIRDSREILALREKNAGVQGEAAAERSELKDRRTMDAAVGAGEAQDVRDAVRGASQSAQDAVRARNEANKGEAIRGQRWVTALAEQKSAATRGRRDTGLEKLAAIREQQANDRNAISNLDADVAGAKQSLVERIESEAIKARAEKPVAEAQKALRDAEERVADIKGKVRGEFGQLHQEALSRIVSEAQGLRELDIERSLSPKTQEILRFLLDKREANNPRALAEIEKMLADGGKQWRIDREAELGALSDAHMAKLRQNVADAEAAKGQAVPRSPEDVLRDEIAQKQSALDAEKDRQFRQGTLRIAEGAGVSPERRAEIDAQDALSEGRFENARASQDRREAAIPLTPEQERAKSMQRMAQQLAAMRNRNKAADKMGAVLEGPSETQQSAAIGRGLVAQKMRENQAAALKRKERIATFDDEDAARADLEGKSIEGMYALGYDPRKFGQRATVALTGGRSQATGDTAERRGFNAAVPMVTGGIGGLMGGVPGMVGGAVLGAAGSAIAHKVSPPQVAALVRLNKTGQFEHPAQANRVFRETLAVLNSDIELNQRYSKWRSQFNTPAILSEALATDEELAAKVAERMNAQAQEDAFVGPPDPKKQALKQLRSNQ